MFIGPVGNAQMRYAKPGSNPFTGLSKPDNHQPSWPTEAGRARRSEIPHRVRMDGPDWEMNSGDQLDPFC